MCNDQAHALAMLCERNAPRTTLTPLDPQVLVESLCPGPPMNATRLDRRGDCLETLPHRLSLSVS